MTLSQQRFKTQPWNDQQMLALNAARGKPYFAHLGEQGTGKTWVLINEIAEFWSTGAITGVLVIAPNGVQDNWLEELKDHTPDWVRYRAAAWQASQTKQALKAMEALFAGKDSGELRVLTMNWEALQYKRGIEFALRFARFHSGKLMIAADESHLVKNPTAKRSKTLEDKLKPHASVRRIASGTPFDERPFDAFSQFSFLSESILGTTSYYAFKAEYAEMLPPGHKLVEEIKRKTGKNAQIVAKNNDGTPRYRNLEKLRSLIAPHSFRMVKKDMPEKVYTQIWFDLTPEQQRHYDKMQDEFRMIIADGKDKAVNKLAALGKLTQITSCYYNIDGVAMRIEGPNPRLAALKVQMEIVANENRQAIIWAKYRVESEDIIALCEEEGWSYVVYDGTVSRDDRNDNKRAFQQDGVTFFIGRAKAGGTGLTLTAASTTIYYSNSFSLIERSQSEDRMHRIGQKADSVLYVDILARNTVDKKIVQALRNKKDVATMLMDFSKL